MNRLYWRGESPLARYRIDPLQPTAIIVHGLHKSGTMFLYQLFRRVARARKIAYYSSNHLEPNDDLVTPQIDHDFCLCPIRSFANEPETLSDRLDVHRIFQVRDPRDILVSQYFSYGWRHTDESFDPAIYRQREAIKSMTIDEYVLSRQRVLDPLKKRLAQLTERNPSPNLTILKYEEMVLDFPSWLEKAIQPFSFRVPALIKKRFSIRYRNEFQPDHDKKSHKRSVLPGDHLKQLKPETIARLNQILESELRALNYPLIDQRVETAA
jgi:hypothetical protein